MQQSIQTIIQNKMIKKPVSYIVYALINYLNLPWFGTALWTYINKVKQAGAEMCQAQELAKQALPCKKLWSSSIYKNKSYI